MARGNRREAIFHDDDDRRIFLKTLAEACHFAAAAWNCRRVPEASPLLKFVSCTNITI